MLSRELEQEVKEFFNKLADKVRETFGTGST